MMSPNAISPGGASAAVGICTGQRFTYGFSFFGYGYGAVEVGDVPRMLAQLSNIRLPVKSVKQQLVYHLVMCNIWGHV